MCVLKTCNEAVVESMCKMISVHANTSRGLSFGQYAKEAMIVWNAPAQAESDSFLRAALNDYFGKTDRGSQRPWHFFSIDKTGRLLVSIISKVVDRMKAVTSKFPHMADPANP